MHERLKAAGRESIFYCDMDDHWQQKPPHLLVSDGIVCAQNFSSLLKMDLVYLLALTKMNVAGLPMISSSINTIFRLLLPTPAATIDGTSNK